jgi:hypothetical protein
MSAGSSWPSFLHSHSFRSFLSFIELSSSRTFYLTHINQAVLHKSDHGHLRVHFSGRWDRSSVVDRHDTFVLESGWLMMRSICIDGIEESRVEKRSNLDATTGCTECIRTGPKRIGAAQRFFVVCARECRARLTLFDQCRRLQKTSWRLVKDSKSQLTADSFVICRT